MNKSFCVVLSTFLFCIVSISKVSSATASSTDHSIYFPPQELTILKNIPGPVDELISLLSEYGDAIEAAEDKETCDSLKSELFEKIDALDKKYPGFEPNAKELASIESAFQQFVELTDSSVFYDFSEEEEEEDEETAAALASIYERYSEIEDTGDRFLAITHDYTSKINDSSSMDELMEYVNQYTGIIEKYFDDFEPDASEQSILEKAIEEFSTVLGSAAQKFLEENDEEEE